MARDGKTRKFGVEDELLLTIKNHMYVPKKDNLRWEVLRKFHDSKWEGNLGTHRTNGIIERSYYWPRMRDDIDAYV